MSALIIFSLISDNMEYLLQYFTCTPHKEVNSKFEAKGYSCIGWVVSFIFSVTNAKVQSESEEIWKYQVYSIIVDFETRLRLPAPLNFISYIIMSLEFIFKKVKHFFGWCCKSSCCRRKDALVISDLYKPLL